jgi:hypothetical protein
LTSGFLHGSVSPKSLIIPLWPYQTFSKIHGDISSSRCTNGVVDTGGKWKNIFNQKIFIISFGHLLVVGLDIDTFFLQVHFKLSAV